MPSIYDLSERKPSDAELRHIAIHRDEVSIYDPLAAQKLLKASREFPQLFQKRENDKCPLLESHA